MSVCSNCGMSLPDDAIFCANCGSKIDAKSYVENGAASLNQSSERVDVAANAVDNAATATFNQMTGASPDANQNNYYQQNQTADQGGYYQQNQAADQGGYYQQNQAAGQGGYYQQNQPAGQNYYQQNGYQPTQQIDIGEPVTVKEWLLTMLLMLIPVANIILMFVWAFSNTEKKSKSNYFKAALIWAAVVLVLYIIIFAVVGVSLISMY